MAPISASNRSEPWLVFDGDCGFCTSSARWVARRLSRPGRADARLIPWQRADLAALGVPAARAQHEVLWVTPEGHVSGGAEAFAAWLRYAGRPWAAAGQLMTWPGVRTLAAVVYRWVADHRGRLPGGTPACALDRQPPPG